MQKTIELLQQHDLLRTIHEPLDIYLEIPHIAYVEAKKSDSKALLFTTPIDKKKGITHTTPVLMNIFCNEKAIELFIGNIESISKEIESLIKLKPPVTLGDKFSMLGQLFSLKHTMVKRKRSKGACQEVIKTGESCSLYDLPILQTWEEDAGPFITFGQVYTQSLDGQMNNLGLYRLQVHNKNQLGLHWQIHKDSNHFFHEYKKANKKMPVSIGIGGDPAYVWCGQAPLPKGMFELMLYGFIKKEQAVLVKSITNDIYIPHDNDFVIEGFVDPSKMKIEGPFGDHTGYYTLEEEYPYLNVTAITHKKDPIYCATVVGKPPLEDQYMGLATERIFLPLLQTTAPDVVDYVMPENGVFHNLIIGKIQTLYPGHAQQTMHAFWGVGQMSFVKHAIFVDEDAPDLREYASLTEYILNRFDVDNLLISKGIVDALDHSSNHFALGGKLGIDCTGPIVDSSDIEILEEPQLLQKIQAITSEVTALKHYCTHTKNPITILKVNKTQSQSKVFDSLAPLYSHLRIVIIVDDEGNDLNNPYMLVWRVVNNIDSNRDLFIAHNTIGLDATNKNEQDGFKRRWPKDVSCNKEVLASLKQRNLITMDETFEKNFQL